MLLKAFKSQDLRLSGQERALADGFNEGKLEKSEELGDLIEGYGPNLALKVHLDTSEPQNFMLGFIQT